MSAELRVGLVGLASWDRLLVLDRFPPVGDQAIVRTELSAPGGTTTNTAVALARLGARVRIVTAVGDDAEGALVRSALTAEGIDTNWVIVRPGERTNLATILVTEDPPDRTILWHQGAQLVRGDRLDVAALFDLDVVVLDLPDYGLVRFLADLPVHTAPRARVLGTLTYLADMAPADALELALRVDAVVGCERDLLAVTRSPTLPAALDVLRARMTGATLRTAIVTRGAAGCVLVRPDGTASFPAIAVEAVDPTGAGDAFAGAVAFGIANRWAWERIAAFANAVGGLATRSLGAQSALPTFEAATTRLEQDH